MTSLRAFEVPLTGTMLVEASAGTGKTHTITTLFVRLVLEEGLSVREILVVTFTEAATAELRDRIRKRLRAAYDALSGEPTKDAELAAFAAAAGAQREVFRARARTALQELDLAAISTIHAFCMRMLQEHAFESGARFDLTLLTDTTLLADDVATDYWASRVYGLDPGLYAMRAGQTGLDRACAQKIAAAVAKRPTDTPVLPARVQEVDIATLAASIAEPFQTARATWQREGAQIRQVLLGWKGLNGNTHSKKILGEACDELDVFFAHDGAPGTLDKACSKLTQSSLVRGTNAGAKTPKHDFFVELETLCTALDAAKASLVTDLRLGAAAYVRDHLPARKATLRAQGFDDLLFTLDRAIRGPRGPELAARIAAQFKAALIDEFQDTDPVQYRIFRRVFDGASRLLLVGDPKQSIYAFRGADVYSYVSAIKAATGGRHTLDENRRSDPSLVRAVNAIFAPHADPFRLPDIRFQEVNAHTPEDRLSPKGSPFEIHFLPRAGDKPTNKGDYDKLVPRLVGAEICHFLRAGATITPRPDAPPAPVRPGDLAVLTRTNAQARAVQAELRALGIPTALQSDESVFASDEAAEVEYLLRAVLEPTQSRAVRTALATTVAGHSANAIATLETDEHAWDRESGRFRRWQKIWDDHGFLQAYRRMLTDLGAEARLLALVDGERRLTNLLHLGELLHGVASRDRLGKGALVRWLALTRAQVLDGDDVKDVPEATELRLESDAHAVKLLTIHKSKGLEFPIVYCPFLNGVRLPKEKDAVLDFHDPAAGHALTLDVQPKKDGASFLQKTKEVLAENQRLLYVALTRAKHRCVVVWGAINEAEASPFAYLLHGGPEAYEEKTDAQLKADFAKLEKASGGAVRVVEIDREAEGEPWSDPASASRAAVPLAARPFARERVDRWFRIGSFTGLTRGAPGDAHGAEIDPEAQGRDHDEVEERTSLLPAAPGASSEPVLMHAFPRGAKAGTTLHAVLEVVDFQSRDDAALRALIAAKLTEAGYADAEHGETLARGVRAMLDTPLDGGLTLSAIPRAKRRDELAFVFPVANAQRGAVLSVGKLADVFDAHASPAVQEAYAASLRSLRFLPLRGFLKGFIDLVFEHEGRFYVVDYKSNHLGDKPEHYRGSCLAKAMAHHDYYLQYHLYVVAVHRWLRARLRGYDYDRHFGGVFYLFARGMSPDWPGRGVFADRPLRALVEALSEVMDD